MSVRSAFDEKMARRVQVSIRDNRLQNSLQSSKMLCGGTVGAVVGALDPLCWGFVSAIAARRIQRADYPTGKDSLLIWTVLLAGVGQNDGERADNWYKKGTVDLGSARRLK